MCRSGDILINIFSLSAALSPARLGPCYRGGNNAAQQHIICAFKWECLRVMSAICICYLKLKGWGSAVVGAGEGDRVGGDLCYRTCHML